MFDPSAAPPPTPTSPSEAQSPLSPLTSAFPPNQAFDSQRKSISSTLPFRLDSAASKTQATPPARKTITLDVRPHRPSLAPILTRLQFPLAPLHPLPCGPAHPAFPSTLLNYNLLTEEQLDSIATYYHQRPRGPWSPSAFWTTAYPAEMHWDDEWLAHVGQKRADLGETDDLAGAVRRTRIKRRKVGRFIGLRFCDTPADESAAFERWKWIKRESRAKAEDIAFWGRRGWRA